MLSQLVGLVHGRVSEADRISCFNRHYAEFSGSWERTGLPADIASAPLRIHGAVGAIETSCYHIVMQPCSASDSMLYHPISNQTSDLQSPICQTYGALLIFVFCTSSPRSRSNKWLHYHVLRLCDRHRALYIYSSVIVIFTQYILVELYHIVFNSVLFLVLYVRQSTL